MTRLGVLKPDGKPRALLVALQKEDTKRSILCNLCKLKESDNKQYEGIAINHDMTSEEKVNNKKLLEGARKKRE